MSSRQGQPLRGVPLYSAAYLSSAHWTATRTWVSVVIPVHQNTLRTEQVATVGLHSVLRLLQAYGAGQEGGLGLESGRGSLSTWEMEGKWKINRNSVGPVAHIPPSGTLLCLVSVSDSAIPAQFVHGHGLFTRDRVLYPWFYTSCR